MAKIYLSATYSDLKAYRDAVYRILRMLRHDVISMEDYVATDDYPLHKCLADVADCNLYVGLVGWRYGYIPEKDNPERKSITELEYRQAGESGLPRLMFLADPAARWPDESKDAETGEGERGQRIAAFRTELEREKLVSHFKTPDHLAGRVSVAVQQELEKTSPRPEPGSRIQQARRSALEQRLDNLLADYQSATEQLAYTLSAVGQNRLKRQIEALERDMQELEGEFDALPEQHDLRGYQAHGERSGADNYQSYYQSRLNAWSDPRYALDKRFVKLTLLLDQGEDAQGPRWAAQERKFEDLQEVLKHVPDQAVVLLGPPGCGKSTLLRHFELDAARTVLAGNAGNEFQHGPLTFFVPLNDYKAQQRGDPLPLPHDWLAERWATQYPALPPLDDLLRMKRLTLLLDALNEIPHPGNEPVRLWKDFLQDLNRECLGNRVIFSCRSLDYSAPLSAKDLPVPQVRIEPLSDAQVKAFVECYCPQHAEALWQNLEGSRQLELLRSPYYLKLLVAQTIEGEIPEGRAALFTGFARQALKREIEADNPLFRPDEFITERDCQRLIQARQWKTPYELPSRGILFRKLSTLAYEMQVQGSEQEAKQVRIGYDDALEILNHERDEDILKAGEALGVIEEDLGRDEVLYVHQLLQEYFAGRRLGESPEAGRVRVAWESGGISPRLEETLAKIADSDPLPPLPGTGWEETTVLAAAMVDNPDTFVAELMKANLPLAGRCAVQPDVGISGELKSELRQALIGRTQNPRADLRARIAAGLALGELGDPRFERCDGPEGRYLLPPLVEIPGGTYRIGSDEGLYEDESPMHTVELKPFQIGKFPVTVAEWTLFMQAGGYDDQRWWVTEEDKAWQSGESTSEGAKRQQRENRKLFQEQFDQIRSWQKEGRITSKQADDWEQIAQMSDEAFEALLDEWYPTGRQTQPAFWNDDFYNSSSQPVVGVSWHEARAYCAWLSAQTGSDFRLPTEAEWAAAARGRESRRYAYGNDFDKSLGNTFETHIRHTTPIGVFPAGDTPEGLVDMAGNTWDWISSLYTPYPYDATDGRENPITGDDGRRVLRGGSWGSGQGLARAAFRNGDAPNYRGDGCGFRLACVAPILDH